MTGVFEWLWEHVLVSRDGFGGECIWVSMVLVANTVGLVGLWLEIQLSWHGLGGKYSCLGMALVGNTAVLAWLW